MGKHTHTQLEMGREMTVTVVCEPKYEEPLGKRPEPGANGVAKLCDKHRFFFH